MADKKVSGAARLTPWLIWLSVTVFAVFQQYMGTFFGLTVDQLAKMYSVSKSNITTMASLYFFSYGLMQIPAGLLLDRFNKKLVLSLATATALLGVLVFTLVPVYAIGLLAAFLLGIGTSFVFVAAAILFIEWFPAYRFALVFGMFAGVACFFTAVLCTLTEKHVSDVGIRMVLMAATLLCSASFALALVFVRGRKKEPESGLPSIPAISPLKSLKAVLGGKQGWLAALYNGLLFGPALAFCSFWNFSYQETYDHTTSQAVMINNMVFLGLAVGAPLAGWLSDKIGRRVLAAQIFATGSLLCMVLILSDVIFSTTGIFFIMFLFGVFSNAVPVGYAFAKEHTAPENHGAVTGFINTFTFAGITVLQFMPGVFFKYMEPFYKSMHAYHTALLIFPLCTIGAVTATYFMKETYCQPQK